MHVEFKNKMQFENLAVEVYANRTLMGKAAADGVVNAINTLLEEKNSVRIIFAAAPSQNELLRELSLHTEIDWSRITAFHMDEYLGLNKDAPQAFGQFLKDRVFDKLQFGKVHYLSTVDSNYARICKDYEYLLKEEPIDIVCMGTGENGHIAFNDPPYANFNDTVWVKIVELDNISRQQQVNDGCFKTIDEVPKKAITLTIPALLSAGKLFVVVPGKTKANAIKNSLLNPITENCPASILRKYKNARLYLDEDSSSLLNLE